MTDTTQGQDAPNDAALFNEAVSTTTLEKFENPPDPKPEEPKPADPPKPIDKPAEPDAPIPPGRLREESELRRRAERERDELQRRMDALLVRQQPQQPQPKPDLFENPDGFIDQRVDPRLDSLRTEFRTALTEQSLENAVDRFGQEKVNAAYAALADGMQRGDPEVKAVYDRVMASANPYGVIMRWHQQEETRRTVGNDIEAYRKRVIEEALNDPEVQKRFHEKQREQALATGNSVARPVKPVAASSPSLGDVGGGGQAQVVEPSDIDLFRQATSAKRR